MKDVIWGLLLEMFHSPHHNHQPHPILYHARDPRTAHPRPPRGVPLGECVVALARGCSIAGERTGAAAPRTSTFHVPTDTGLARTASSQGVVACMWVLMPLSSLSAPWSFVHAVNASSFVRASMPDRKNRL